MQFSMNIKIVYSDHSVFFLDGRLLQSLAGLFKAFIAFLVAFQTLFFTILISIPINRFKTDTIRSRHYYANGIEHWIYQEVTISS